MLKETIAGVGLSMALGVGIGLAVESRTNEAAEGRALTAQACVEGYPHERTITPDIVKCLESGAPGGDEIDKKVFHAGDPTSLVESYILSQKREAASIELGRVVGWSFMPMGVGAGILFFGR